MSAGTVTIRWRPGAEQPSTPAPTTTLIAVRDDTPDADVFLAGIYCWRGGRWESEDTGEVIADPEFWWVPEEELVNGVLR